MGRINYEGFYWSLYRIRRVEEEIARIYPTDAIKSPVHLSIGQEAISVGVCEALGDQDIVFGTYRGHALYLAKGGDLKGMLAELYGKSTGVAKGKGGSMHLIDTSVGVMGMSAIVATTIPQAVGYAYAMKVQKKDSVVVSFFGDGATEEGVFHESLNFAALMKLPIVFICENNAYAIRAHRRERQPQDGIFNHSLAYGIPGEKLAGDDVIQIYDSVKKAVSNIRDNQTGPVFFECTTYRWMEHVGPNEDFDKGYRSREEAEPWYASDQVKFIGQQLEQKVREKIEADVEAEIVDAFTFADESPFPEDHEIYTHVFQGE
jgi:TPP-dependent pyruvate/acetoin dehydrogenase alpha subunit